MQAVGADQQPAVDFQVTAVLRFDERGHAIDSVAVAGDPVAQPHRVGAEPIEHRPVQQHLQLAAMHRVLRPAIACEQAARLGVDVVAVAPDQGPLPCLDADAVEHLVVDGEVIQLSHRVGLQVMPTPSGCRSATAS